MDVWIYVWADLSASSPRPEKSVRNTLVSESTMSRRNWSSAILAATVGRRSICVSCVRARA